LRYDNEGDGYVGRLGNSEGWRPVGESKPCRRREREATYYNSMELSGMDSTLPHLKDSGGTPIGRLMDARFPGLWLLLHWNLMQ
jgi:hypothetical protein